MSAAIAMAPSPAPHDRPAFPTESSPPSAQRTSTASAPAAAHPLSGTPGASAHAQRSGSGSPRGAQNTPSSGAVRTSPHSVALNGGAPKIFVKKEPGSPAPEHTPRRRPKGLDLSKGASISSNTPGTARPLTSRDGLGIQEVGLACLSPGFVTQDPVMKEQLRLSWSVRDQQRLIIEQRMQQSAKGDGPDQQPQQQSAKDKDGSGGFAAKTPGMSRRNKAPPGLSIVAPSHEQFANDPLKRVIQSAPLGQTFTGMHNPHPLTRHIANQPSKLSNTSHIHHVPATQTNNRLPPLSDVFGHQGLPSGHPQPPESAGGSHHTMFVQPQQQQSQQQQSQQQQSQQQQSQQQQSQQQQSQQQHHQHHQQQQQQQIASRAPPASPNHLQQGHAHGPLAPHAHSTARPREYKSAEEAQAELAGGRPELLPKIVHYGGHQPPTPPSPQPGHPSRAADGSRSASRRRTRAEYEDGGSPPLGTGRAPRRGPFGEGSDSPETQRQKREEFIRLCERAWDLFHS